MPQVLQEREHAGHLHAHFAVEYDVEFERVEEREGHGGEKERYGQEHEQFGDVRAFRL